MSRLVLAVLILALLAGCSTGLGNGTLGSGKLATKSFSLSGFTRIDANSGANVQVTRGDAFAVEVDVDDNLVSALDVRVSGDTLIVALKNGSYTNVTLRARVTMPELKGVKLNGGSVLTAILAGEDVDLNLNGGGEANLTGTAGRLTIDTNGGSAALLSGLAAGDVLLTANGGSRIEVNSSGRVTGTANGGATVVVSGSPASVDVQTDGGAQVTTK